LIIKSIVVDNKSVEQIVDIVKHLCFSHHLDALTIH